MFGPYGRAQSVVGVIGQRDDFAFAIEGDHAAAWTKDFLPHHCAVVSQAGPQRGFPVEAARLIALDLRPSAAGDTRRSSFHHFLVTATNLFTVLFALPSPTEERI